MSAFYQSEIVRIIPSGNAAGVLIPNVQSISTAFQVQRRESLRLGRFAPNPYRVSEQDPLINVNVDFIPSGSDIFSTLGLMGSVSMIDNLISGNYKWNDMKIQVRELVGGGSAVGTINLRSGVLTNYTFQAAVGQTPKTTVAIEFLDIGMDDSTAVVPPTVDDGYPALRTQDIDISLPAGIFGIDTIYPQNFQFSLPLQRNAITKIGQRKPVSREISSPVMATFQIQGIIDTFQSTANVSGNSLFDVTCGAPINGNIGITVRRPTCTGEATETLVTYTMVKPYLDSVNFSNSVGGYTSVDLQFSIPVTFENVAGESNVRMA
jgi:hypothetical protein